MRILATARRRAGCGRTGKDGAVKRKLLVGATFVAVLVALGISQNMLEEKAHGAGQTAGAGADV